MLDRDGGIVTRGDGMELAASVARDCGVPLRQVLSRDKGQFAVQARWAAMLAMRWSGLSYPSIGQILHRDHSTVIHGLRRAASDPTVVGLAKRAAQRYGVVSPSEM